MSVGQLRDFDIKNGNWTAYCERLEMYFLANKVDDTVKLPTLISLMGEDAYELLSTLASPKKPSELTFANAVELLKKHLQPKPSVLAERFKFRQRRQMEGELIADYVAELKKLAMHCEFTTTLEDNLRDQFVCGIKSELTRQRLFAEDNKLTYSKAVTLACTLEAAERDASAVDRNFSASMEVNKLHVMVKCMACGDNQHKTESCKYRNYGCSFCKRIGHLRRMCPENQQHQNSRRGYVTAEESERASRGLSVSGGGRRGRGGRGRRGARGRSHTGAYWMQEPAGESNILGQPEEADDDSASDDDAEEPMYQMSLTNYRPVCMSLFVHNRPLLMEVDTGSALSCVSGDTYRRCFYDLVLKPCRLNLKFYDGSVVQPLGYLEVDVSHRNMTKRLDLYVLDRATTNLLGRQWLFELNIEIPKVNMSNVMHNKQLDKRVIINDLISRHESLFDGTLGRYTGSPVKLCVREGAEPIYCRARPLPYAMRARVDAELDAMLRAGVIEPVDHSDWATPLVIASKADGGIRICADYKVTLNKVLQVDRYPVPKLDDMFSGLSNNKYFTKLDLSQAYNQLVLDEDSRAYTVINTHRGLFKYNRLVFGLSSSPGIFQKFMVNLLRDIPDVVVFYDDILIKSRDINSHVKAIEQVFSVLQSSGLKLRRKKCDFLSNQVQYLGFIVDENGVRVNPDKIKPIVDMPHPKNTTELKSFLGMVNFYGKFVSNLSEHLAPLYDLLKKGRQFIWRREHNEVFIYVKKMLCSTEVLAHYDMARPTVVTCDASSRGIGALLAQRSPGGGERVVAYASRALTEHEKHYSQIHKEALAIIFAVDKFHQYLYGRKFILRTDHKPLVSIFGPNTGVPVTAASRLQRWAIKLSAYDFTIEYIRTDKNTADVLSRLIKTHKEEAVAGQEELPEQTYLHFATEALLLDYKVLKRETRNDPILSRVMGYLADGWPGDIEIKELKPYFNRRNELYCELGCILWGHRVVIPASCRERVISELHEAHMGIVKTKALARSYVWWPGVDEAVEARCRACAVCASVADAPVAHVPCAWPWPDRPWARLHIDFLSISGLTYLITVDACSKWIEASKMKTTTAEAVIAALRELWARFGLPKQLVSDNGPPFTSAQFESFLKQNGIEHIFSSPYHPASNGAAENSVKICKRAIKKAQKQKLDIDVALNRFLLNYRNTEHYTTGESPAKILQGRNLRMRLDQLKPERSARVSEHQAQAAARARGARRQLCPGDTVWYRDYRARDKWLAGQVARKLGSTDYTIDSNIGTGIHRHIDQLRRRVSDSTVNIRTPPAVTARRRSSSSLVLPEEGARPEDGAGTVAPETMEPVGSGVPETSDHVSGSNTTTGEIGNVKEPAPKVHQVEQPRRVIKPPVRFGFDEYF